MQSNDNKKEQLGDPGRKRRGRRRSRHHGATGASAALTVTRPRRLNLELPVTEPLSAEEQREMQAHLVLFRTFKPYLGLSLNAAEDLLINGATAPTDRGMVKHLLSKLDRRAVERALGKEALRSDAGLRARFLAGVVRIQPDVSSLLSYLEALTHVADKRDAAAAFGATIERLAFDQLSVTQTAGLLDVINKTFQDHERIQVLFGLLGSDSFRAVLERSMDAIAEPLRDVFAPLSAAYRAVLLGVHPKDTTERALVERGIATWLAAPERILRGYSLEIRKRLVEHALGELDISAIAKPTRILVDSLPREDEASARIGLVLFDRLVAQRQDDPARALLNAIVQAHPRLGAARRRQETLAWPRVGRLALAPDQKGEPLRRAYWLDLPGFVWARLGSPSDAAAMEAEADLQARLALPGVVLCIGQGAGGDATPYVVLAPGGRLLEPSFARSLTIPDALAFALEGVSILGAVAAAGVDLPDASPARFVSERAPTSLRLLDMSGATAKPRDACMARAPELAAHFCRDFLRGPERGLRPDLPGDAALAIGKPASIAEMVKVLATAQARAWDKGRDPPLPPEPKKEPPPKPPPAKEPEAEPDDDFVEEIVEETKS
jgi:hypothetical protein